MRCLWISRPAQKATPLCWPFSKRRKMILMQLPVSMTICTVCLQMNVNWQSR